MTTNDSVQVSVLGLGAMGSALAAALVKAGHATTVWNRSAGKADNLVAQGAQAAATAGDAVRASRLVIACLLDHASVHEVLDPLSDELAGRTLINVTTTSPEQSRELAAWAADAGVAYLDGGIMAVPAHDRPARVIDPLQRIGRRLRPVQAAARTVGRQYLLR